MIPIRLIQSATKLENAIQKICACKRIAVDCEGAQLGRFGKVDLLSIFAADEIFIFDFKSDPDLAPALSPVLETETVLKLFHDCREDASALFHGHGLGLQRVWDSQVGHNAVLEICGGANYQSSLTALAKIYGFVDYKPPKLPHTFDLKKFPGAVEYAASGVLPLFDLFSEISTELGDVDGAAVSARSSKNSKLYPQLNVAEVPDVASLRPGLPVNGVLAEPTETGGALFRLNLGNILGVAKPAKWLSSCSVGDSVSLEVGPDGLSECKKILSVAARGESEGAVIIERFGELHSINPKKMERGPRSNSSYSLRNFKQAIKT